MTIVRVAWMQALLVFGLLWMSGCGSSHTAKTETISRAGGWIELVEGDSNMVELRVEAPGAHGGESLVLVKLSDLRRDISQHPVGVLRDRGVLFAAVLNKGTARWSMDRSAFAARFGGGIGFEVLVENSMRYDVVTQVRQADVGKFDETQIREGVILLRQVPRPSVVEESGGREEATLGLPVIRLGLEKNEYVVWNHGSDASRLLHVGGLLRESAREDLRTAY